MLKALRPIVILQKDILNYIFLDENLCISIEFKYNKGPIGNHSALIQVMARLWTSDKPLTKPMATQFTDTYMNH